MKISVDEVPHENLIAVRISGEDLKFQASSYTISLYLDDNQADKLAFQLGAILQDKEQRKKY